MRLRIQMSDRKWDDDGEYHCFKYVVRDGKPLEIWMDGKRLEDKNV